jgi:hypothetical protein
VSATANQESQRRIQQSTAIAQESLLKLLSSCQGQSEHLTRITRSAISIFESAGHVSQSATGQMEIIPLPTDVVILAALYVAANMVVSSVEAVADVVLDSLDVENSIAATISVETSIDCSIESVDIVTCTFYTEPEDAMVASPNPDQIIIDKANTQTLVAKGLALKDPISGTLTYLNSANLTGTLYDQDGIAVAGMTDVVFSYIASSTGNYTGPIGPDFDAAPGPYVLVLTGAQDANQIKMKRSVTVIDRTS